ncbi:restriction endonuclease subunit S [Aeromonas sp. A5]|uniref:restriction endonuclease subunit S n=1 Tax=unclassified Aeromonas TaxID=257493 RepID=UPI00376F6347
MSWPTVFLGDVTERIDYGLTASAIDNPNGPRFLRITDIQNDSVNWNTVPSCECSKNDIKDNELQVGDIVFARTGATTGKSYLIRELSLTAVFASYLIRVRAKPCIDTLYLSHFFKSGFYWSQINSMANGAAQPGVNSSKLKNLQIPFPPLEEQKRIAAILDKADAIRQKRMQAIALADDFLRSVFLDMFGDPVTNPKGWDEVILKDIADIRSGVTKGKIVKEDDAITLPYMRVANVQDGYLDLSSIQEITVSQKDAKKSMLQIGDILLTEGGDPDKLGRGHVWNGEIENCIHQNHIFSVRVTDSNYVRPSFLSSVISSPRGKKYFLKVGKQTTGIATINKTVLSEFLPFIPPLEMQDKYLGIMKKIKELPIYSECNYMKLFSSLSQKAFTGQL